MEIFEMRYFLAVASGENIHRAAERLHVSPGSLSKAISRLEGELGTKLFSRVGRNIRLTAQGKVLQRRASEITQLEESSKLEIAGAKNALNVVLAGPEILLSQSGILVTETIKARHPNAVFEYQAAEDAAVLEKVQRGDAHLGVVTSDPSAGLRSKVIAETTFVTCVGKGHPLYGVARAKKIISIDEVLKHAFVSPSHPLLGQVGVKQSHDGWRDDKFPRKVEYLVSHLKLMEELVTRGKAIAYLPDSFAEKLAIESLKISGCPYTCRQTIKLVSRASRGVGWLNQLF